MSLILSGTDGLSDVDGTAATPAIRGTDTNTGIFFPAADTVGMSTGGSERVRIDSSGNVGIATTPVGSNRKLEVGLTSAATNYIRLNASGSGSALYESIAIGIESAVFGVNATASAISGVGAGTAGLGTAGPYALTFGTNNTERMRIDSSGNVGIGTSSPSALLQLAKASGAADICLSIGGTLYANIYASASDTNIYSVAANPLIFGTTNTERMRIDSSGNVGIGTNSPTLRLSVAGSLNVLSGYQLIAGSASTFGDATIGTPSFQFNGFSGVAAAAVGIVNTTGNIGMIYFRNPNGYVGNISTSGSNTTYTTTSDYRLKENIAPMTGALAVVQKLKSCTYNWKVDGSNGQGFIAHELQSIVPDCVSGEKDEINADGSPRYQSVDTSFLIATLTAAIQELNVKFEEYKATHP